MSPRRALDATMRDLALAIRDVIRQTPEHADTNDPEGVYRDLAHRLVLRLASEGVSILPESASASARIFAVFSEWLRRNPECSYRTKVSPLGRFEIIIEGLPGGEKRFYGASIQDAYAQFAQVIALDVGLL